MSPELQIQSRSEPTIFYWSTELDFDFWLGSGSFFLTEAGAGAGAEIMAKVGAGAENKKFRLRNTAEIRHWQELIV